MNANTAQGEFISNQRNIMQTTNPIQYVTLMNPVVSMLKFKPPFELPISKVLKKAGKAIPEILADDNTYIYADGDVWLQPWANGTSAEVRLIIESSKFFPYQRNEQWAKQYAGIPVEQLPADWSGPQLKAWKISDLENKLFYFNTFVKPAARILNSLGIQENAVPGLKLNFNSAYEIYVWEQWVFAKFGSAPDLQTRKDGVLMILKAVTQYLGKDMSSLRFQDSGKEPFTLPFI